MNRTSLNRTVRGLLLAGAVVGLVNCAGMTPQEQNKATGQIVGGVTGAALGSLVGGGTGRSIAIASGAVIGSVVGGQVATQQNR
jgi:uncharacterized protein YcfJ